MPKFYVTLGQSHRHLIDNKPWDKDSVLEIVAPNASIAEKYAFDNLDKSWSMMTNEEEHDPSFYPNGVIKTVKIN